MDHIIDGCEQACTKRMLEMPITELSRLIGAYWYLPLEDLAKKAGLPKLVIKRAIHGGKVSAEAERKIRETLEGLK